jgi:hypothetical protein
VPSATVRREDQPTTRLPSIEVEVRAQKTTEYERIVAVIPKELKEEIRAHLKLDKSATEKTVILKGLKLLGFNVKNEWLVDKRTLR